MDPTLIASVPSAPWLPAGSTAEVWAGRECVVPDPCIIVRVMLVRHTVGGAEFFCVLTPRGLDLPSLALARGATSLTAAEGLASLATTTHGRPDMTHLCIGYVRNVVPQREPCYPHPTPWAHVPVFEPAEVVEPRCDGTWVTLDTARSDLSVRHWWPIVEHRLDSSAWAGE